MENAKFNKVLNDKYYLMQDIARKYNYSEELLDIITCVYVSFYMDFGKSVDMPLYDLFDRVMIIYDHGNVGEIAQRYGFGEIPGDSVAVTYFDPNFKVFQNEDLKQNPQKIILGTHVGDYFATSALKLEMVTHEVRHSLMGYYNTNKLLDDDTYYMRTGLQETFYTRDDKNPDGFVGKRIGRTLDEILNTYISEVLLNRVKSFSKYDIENRNLRRYIKSIKTVHEDNIYRAIGYHEDLKMFNPLLQQQMFIDLVNQHQFDGEIDIVKEFMESLTDKIDYLG
ncbi:MAG: hypothetical protein K2L98_01215, partial [Bacilli bacterium]|nr:hypothetical protein [Bacilli bacterium]